ncbi:Septal ring factor EnvC, activator of murein hydrolases AmiA and AmiB [Saccharicrinis carchari]|uniref:Septal ring factor EnvC, activator of murein hydrolases AmiA and AmiB n=1 Tax=Saccharicrinis carchari TaxID=1168039 RepID=A0A521CIR2_SACCC|nr:peptidoglycan DD-metalloendopeptidase family protein [Saccharicrinis carchari]SMO58631.1 Septal ring factor EnvC, activator of murein hydrolases AmiA and AmiB [Saccharicrinis carchari]
MEAAYILKYHQHIKLKVYKIALGLIFICAVLGAQTQDIESLKNKRQQYEQEISNAKKLLVKKGNTRQSFLEELAVVNAQIKAQNKVIASFKEQIDISNEVIKKNKASIETLTKELKALKESYHKLIVETNKQVNSNYNEFMIVFSAKSFSEAYRRFNLMKQYASYRKKQGLVLMDTKTELDSIVVENEKVLQRNRMAYESLLKEIEDLKNTVSKKSLYVQNLKKDEKWLKREIAKKEKASKELELVIERAIAKASKETNYAFSNFLSAKGNLIWPVDNGVVTSQFGEHNHAVLKGVKVKNNGIDITAAKESTVKSVYEGTVSRVIAIPGYNKAVIVRHGKFLTVYANLATVNVKSGQLVKSKQSIGQVFAGSKDKNGILHFEIWEENKKTNPLEWLKK